MQTLKRVLKALAGRRALKIYFWGAVVLVTLLVLGYQVSAWRGSRAWKQAAERLEAEGEVFTLDELVPAGVADGENFMAHPLLDGIRVIDGEGPETGPRSEKRRRLAKFFPAAGTGSDGTEMRPPGTNDYGSHTGVREDFVAWLEFAGHSPPVGQRGTEGAAAAWIEFWDPGHGEDFASLAAAAERPRSRPVPSLAALAEGKLLFTVAMPHFQPLQRASRAVALRGAAAAQTGDAETSRASLAVLMQFEQAIVQDPVLVAALVGASVGGLAEGVLWEGLKDKVFTEDDLAWIQERISSVDWKGVLLNALRGELLLALDAMEYIADEGGHAISTLASLGDQGVAAKASTFPDILIPQGWIDQNRATYVNWFLDHQILPLRDGGFTGAAEAWREFEPLLSRSRAEYWRLSHTLLACLIMPATGPLTNEVQYREAKRRQCVIACALERFWLREGRYPDALTALVPDLLDSVPSDPCDDGPMRYRKVGDRYRIWALGADGVDGGGDSGNGGQRPADRRFIGDWVWRYQSQE